MKSQTKNNFRGQCDWIVLNVTDFCLPQIRFCFPQLRTPSFDESVTVNEFHRLRG